MIINWLRYPILDFFKHEKDAVFFLFIKNMIGKILGFGKIIWTLKKILEKFIFKKNISEKIGYFNIGFVFYIVNIQPDIMHNW